jgi:hypothetical protein
MNFACLRCLPGIEHGQVVVPCTLNGSPSSCAASSPRTRAASPASALPGLDLTCHASDRRRASSVPASPHHRAQEPVRAAAVQRQRASSGRVRRTPAQPMALDLRALDDVANEQRADVRCDAHQSRGRGSACRAARGCEHRCLTVKIGIWLFRVRLSGESWLQCYHRDHLNKTA